MSVKSQQVAKPAVARPVRAAQGVTAQVRGFAGNHTLMRKQQEADRVADEQLQGGRSKAESRTGMPWQLKAGLEALSGMDLSGIRIHRNSSKPDQLNALAYTEGQEIHVGPGQEAHLPHEGWHAVQQMQGRVKPTIQAKGKSINDDAALEREADVMGAKALQEKSFGQNHQVLAAPSAA